MTVTNNTCPAVTASGSMLIEKCPSSSTVPSAITLPSASVITTVPGSSDVPVTV